MKQIKLKRVLMFFAVWLTTINSFSQNVINSCGAAYTNDEVVAMRGAMSYAVDNPAQKLRFVIKHHIVYKPGQKATAQAAVGDIFVLINKVNTIFQGGNIEFINCNDVGYIEKDWNFIDGDRIYDLTNCCNQEGAIDVYWTLRTQDSNGNPNGGFSTGSNSAIAIPYTAREIVLAHELGHHFSLFHTHGNYNGGTGTTELVNRNESNCGYGHHADEICDTEADPQLWNGCTFSGTGAAAKDAEGATYHPDPFNIMSYSPCQSYFTQGQFTRMRNYMRGSNQSADDELSKYVLNITQNINSKTDIYSSAYVNASNTITGTSNINYFGVLNIYLKPGFTVKSGPVFNAHIWAACNQLSHNARQTTAIINDDQPNHGNDGLLLSPNPATDKISIQSDVRIKSVQCFNTFGQLVDVKLSDNGFSISHLPNGMYFLSVISENGSEVSKKFIKE
jgi:hypothetical protein